MLDCEWIITCRTQTIKHLLIGESGQLKILMFLHHINDGVGGNIIHGETGHRGVAVLLEHQQSVLPRVDLEPLHQLFTLWISDLNIANSNSVSEPEIVIGSFLIG